MNNSDPDEREVRQLSDGDMVQLGNMPVQARRPEFGPIACLNKELGIAIHS